MNVKHTKQNARPSWAIRARVWLTRVIIRTVILAIMAACLYVSYLDIRKTGLAWGMTDIQARLFPLFIDGVALAGRLSMSPLWDEKTRSRGFWWLMVPGGVMSLICNVCAADEFGQGVIGVLVVIAVLVLEAHVGKMFALGITKTGQPRKTRSAAQQAQINAKSKATRASKAQTPAPAPAPAKTSRTRAPRLVPVTP